MSRSLHISAKSHLTTHMLRRQGIRAFSSASRRPFRLPSSRNRFADGSTFTIQRVRFQRQPIFTRKRLASALLYAVPAYVVWHYFFPVVAELDIDDQAQRISGSGGVDVQRNTRPDEEEDDDDEYEGDEDAFFIPFSWPKELPRTYYRGSDPEWQEYVKFSRDEEKHKDVQRQLISKIRTEIGERLSWERYLGQIDMRKGKSWVEFQFPDGPPLEYEVSGLQIGEEYIAWVRKPMSQVEYQKLERIMIPTAAFWSVWAATKYLLGLGPAIRRIDDPYQSQVQKGKGGTSARGESPSAGQKTVEDAPKQRTASQDSSGSSKDASSRSPDPEQTGFGFPRLPGLPSPSSEKPFTLMVFMRSMSQNSKPYKIDTPRGTILVTGLIEVVGTRGRATLDVDAAYDPKANEFVVYGYRVRRIQPKRQSPRGGP